MMAADLFTEINNAVLDIQQADYQGVERPLQQLRRLLDHPDLKGVNENLTAGLDLESFLGGSSDTHGITGSARLHWPEDRREDLGLRLMLIRKVSADANAAFQFSHTYYAAAGSKIIASIHNMNRQLIIPFVRDYKAYVLSQGKTEVKLIQPLSKRIFIVHGHDGEAREAVARYLGSLGFEPIILHEQASRNRTVIEKIEAHSDVSFAVVLLTPDDEGRAKVTEELEPRARQNVLLELGYFMGKLGRANVCALKRGTVMIPSDFAGVVWTDMDPGGGWRAALGKELQAAGHQIDWNKVMRT